MKTLRRYLRRADHATSADWFDFACLGFLLLAALVVAGFAVYSADYFFGGRRY